MNNYFDSAPKRSDIMFSWFIVFCGVIGAMNLAKLAPSMSKLIDHFNISLSISGLIGAIFSALMILTGLTSGIIISKYGPRLAMLCGLMLSFLGSVAPVLYPIISIIMLGRILEGYGFLLINLSAPVLLTLHTDKKNRGKVMGIWGSFMPAGNALIILIAPIIYMFSNWLFLWEVTAISAATILSLAYFIIPRDPEHFKKSFTEQISSTAIKTIKNLSITIVGATFACHSLIFLGNMQFLPYYFERVIGFSATFSYLATASYCIVSFLGHLYCGFLLNRGYKPEKLISFAFIVAGIFVALFFGMFDGLFLHGVHLNIKLCSIFLVAFFMGLTPPTIFYLVSFINPPSKVTPINYGYMVQVQAIGIFAGSFLFGWLVDFTGEWRIIGLLSILVSIFGIIGGTISSKLINRNAN